MKHSILVLILFSLVFVVACGSSDRANTVELPKPIETIEPTKIILTLEGTAVPTEEPTINSTATLVPTETPKPTNKEVNEEHLMALLLTINDMPTGWIETWEAYSVAEILEDDFSFLCKENPARTILGYAHVQFGQVEVAGLDEYVIIYESVQEAENAFKDYAIEAAECTEWTDSSGQTDKVIPLSFPNISDETFAYRRKHNINGDYLFDGDYIYVREGNAIIMIGNLASPNEVDTMLTEEFVMKALERLNENK